jgi:hypothetical protein
MRDAPRSEMAGPRCPGAGILRSATSCTSVEGAANCSDAALMEARISSTVNSHSGRRPAAFNASRNARVAASGVMVPCDGYASSTRSRKTHFFLSASPASSRPALRITGGADVMCWVPACMSRNRRWIVPPRNATVPAEV